MDVIRRSMTKDLVIEITEITNKDDQERIIDFCLLWKGKFLSGGTQVKIQDVKGTLDEIIDNYNGFVSVWSDVIQNLSARVHKDMDTLKESVDAFTEFNNWIDETLKKGKQ